MLPEFPLPFHGLIAQMATHRNEGISGIEVLPKNVKICITCGPKFSRPRRYLFPWFGFKAKEFGCANLETIRDQLHDLLSQGEVMSVRNSISLLVALSTLLFLIACGSSSAHNSTPPPSGAFSNTNFNGTYTFSISGVNGNGVFAMAGSLVACGCSAGTISSGTVDFDDPTTSAPSSTIGNNSTYTISSDGRGFARLFITTTASVAFEVDIDFVLTSSAHGAVIRYDVNGTGSGTLDLQASSIALGTTTYSFSLSGSDLTNVPLAAVGAFTLDSSGNIVTTGTSAGVEDFNFGATPSPQLVLSGSVTVGSGITPGSAALNTSFGNFAFDVYAIDSSHLKLIEKDGQAILVGDVFTQTSATIPSGNLVFTMEGLDTSNNLFATGGLMTSDGSSLIPSGSEDVNDAGTVDNNTNPATPFSFSGSFAATGGGRLLVSLTGFVGGSSFAAYPSDGGLLMLEIDTGLNAGVTSGVALPQTNGASISASQGYGLNLSGEDFVNTVELDEIGEFKTTSTTFTNGLLDENDLGPLNPQNFSGTYTTGSNGFGSATLTSGLQSMFFYASDSNLLLFISTDPNQAAVGALEIQTTPSAAQAAVKARPLPMLRSMPHPHSALQGNKTRFSIKSK